MPSPERTLLFSRSRFIVGLAVLVLGLVAAPVSAAAPPSIPLVDDWAITPN